MRLVTITNLYPSADRPRHGIFVEERLRHLVGSGRVSAHVLALRPSATAWTPRSRGAAAAIPAERRHGITVEYPRVPTLPLVTNWVDPWIWAAATSRRVHELLEQDSDGVVLDAHFLYPDAVAAVLLGKRFGVPVVISARGSDVNVKCENPIMRRWVRWAAANSAALIAVSQALAARLAALRIQAPIIEVVRNGVDLEKFRPLDRTACRKELGAAKRMLLSVGHLVPEKGHGLAIEAVARIPDAALVIVGTGPERGALERLARRLGVETRVRFLGLIPHERMNAIYNGADALVLASVREGMPNVVLESLAAGTRVVATDVGGIGEIVRSPAAGILLRERSATAICDALGRVFEQNVAVDATRAYAETLGWGEVVDRQLALYRRVLGTGAPPLPVTPGLNAR